MSSKMSETGPWLAQIDWHQVLWVTSRGKFAQSHLSKDGPFHLSRNSHEKSETIVWKNIEITAGFLFNACSGSRRERLLSSALSGSHEYLAWCHHCSNGGRSFELGEEELFKNALTYYTFDTFLSYKNPWEPSFFCRTNSLSSAKDSKRRFVKSSMMFLFPEKTEGYFIFLN